MAFHANNFVLSSVLVGRDVYPLFQAGKSLSSKKFLFLEMSLSSKVFLILEIKVSSVLVGRDVYPLFSDREEFIL